MRVTVLYFASVRERRGRASETLDLDGPTTIGDLYADLLGADAPTVAYTRNRVVCAPDTALADGDEVSFLPPLGGG
ncbi:MAG: MoaD/ThiS family protein [Myxococcales bacterium]|nr:MoaD/ThiS family protein [Myxococcales bacterium]MCB9690295.1 MoaD/ThiS family protein [Alphaproteobacteria bacterium]